jgi:preprotein translocase subunit SecA
MLSKLLLKVVGSKNERELKRVSPIVDRINELESGIQPLSDDELKQKMDEYRQRVENGEALDDILPEVFAVVRETAQRILGERHYDVQLVGGIVLHEGKIAEMKTGEGKTLVATLPVCLNALTGKGVHVVTVNDYLAKRDAEWMGAIYNFLGFSVGVVTHELLDEERKKAYGADITYGTNNEFGFDYLRDNMKFDINDYVQRELNYAIIDEVDSILIDEARTPLIISGPAEESTEKYYTIDRIIPFLKKEIDYTIDEKAHSSVLTEEGVLKVERLLKIDNLYDPRHIDTLHHVNQALKAHTLFKRDVDYVVKNGEVIIVDEFTGRLMPGRRYSDGLHQALEAKEKVKIENENQTLATISFQNYFRMYDKLSGMTGTADTEAVEFKKIYDLDVMVIPTNRPMIRKDFQDVIYKTEKEKFKAVVEEIVDCYHRGQPALVGTISIEKSEKLSSMLKKRGIPHNVLNAKHHEREAEIVAQAGRKKAVTISTNMAGRGTDIVLGGNYKMIAEKKIKPEMSEEEKKKIYEEAKKLTKKEHEEVIAAGGLHIIGTERHESRRIDNQLRGRSGRQGDPGSSRFYLSLEDDLLRIFGSERISGVMDKLGIEEGEPIEHKFITKAIENAQKRVEGQNFEIRKQLLEYDDVMNKQREVIYGWRREVLTSENLREEIMDMASEILPEILAPFIEEKKYPEEWNWNGIQDALFKQFHIRLDLTDEVKENATLEGLQEMAEEAVEKFYVSKESQYGEEIMRFLEKMILLQSIDTNWKDHLFAIDQLREGVSLQGYGQQDPLRVYQRDAFDMFEEMIFRIKQDAVEKLFAVEIEREEVVEDLTYLPMADESAISMGRGEMMQRPMAQAGGFAPPPEASGGGDKPVTYRRAGKKIGRNDPCPCGSGKKYKKCCGRGL